MQYPLKSINSSQLVPSSDLRSRLDELKKFTRKTWRGCRAGRHLQRQIQVINTQRDTQPKDTMAVRGVNLSNLAQVQLVNNSRIPINNGSVVCPNPNESSTQSARLPNFLMTYAQSMIVNKLEEAEIVFEKQASGHWNNY